MPSPQEPPPPAGLPPGMPAPRDLTGKTLGEFTVLRRLGQGGMGQVYLAEQKSLKRKVAIKILKADLAANPASLKRFRAEAEVVARATHANIVQVYAIGEAEGVHYMALEYVDGLNLREYLIKKGPPEVPLALSIMRQVAAALARAGELGITHRDIKPENILLTRKGEVKVADFGLSRDDQQPLNITQSGVTMGTPLYMSPEQVQGHPVDPRTDIYSFGVTCYHMLGGNPPFRGQSAFEVAIQHVQNEPAPLHTVRPDLPPDLCALVDRMMAKKPEDRYQSGREILRELNRLREILAGGSQIQKTAAGLSGPSSSTALPPAATSQTSAPALVASAPRRRRVGFYAAVAGGLALALAGGAALALKTNRLPPPPRNADGEAARGLPEEERFLRQEVETYVKPGDDPRRLENGIRAHINLGLFLIEQNRLKEADEFFSRLSENPQQEYSELGKLGQAIVLAFHDQFGPSNQLFLECKRKLDGQPARAATIWNHPRLRLLVARALDRNFLASEAAKESFPAELDRLRKPGPYVMGLKGRDKK